MRSTDGAHRFVVALSVALLLGVPACGRTRSHVTQEQAVLVDRADTFGELVRGSSLIVVGRPVGRPEERPLADGLTSDYWQHVSVTRVLRGPATTDVLVVRAGRASTAPAVSDPDAALRGPLHAGEHVLFLRAGGTPGSYAVVGHEQGDLLLHHGTVATPPFPVLAHADVETVARLVAAA